MANNMDSFDFGALDSVAFDETLSFLNSYDPTPLPDPSLGGFEGFGDPMMDWPVAENHPWAPLGNPDLLGGVTNALTDNSLPGSHFPMPGWGVQSGPYQQDQVMGAETPLAFGESRRSKCKRPNVRDSFLRGSEHDVSDLEESQQSMDKIPLPCLACDWPSCKSVTIYGTIRDLQNHQTDVHIAEILKAWPGSCSWPGCNSKIFFKTSKRLESHVYNIHITPLSCTTTGCDHKRPFERQADLERHIASRHMKQRNYKCPYPHCRYSSTFSRKDKLKHHERTYHGQFNCQFNHCIYGFPSEIKLRKHRSSWPAHDNYSPYECDLGSCRHTSISHFGWSDLMRHAERDHMIPYDVASQAVNMLIHPNRVLTLAHFLNDIPGFQDCEGCVKKLKEAASSKEGKEKK